MGRPPRVVHVITRMILGGAQEDALLTVDGLRQTGRWEVGLVTGGDLGSEGELMTRARSLGVPLAVIPSMHRELRPHDDFLAAAALRRMFGELRPDVVQTHSSKAGILGRWAAHRAGVPVVVHRIHGLAFHPYESGVRNAIYRASERIAAPWTDRLVVVADAMKRQALAAGVGREEQYVRIPTGMDVAPYLGATDDTRRIVRAELGFAPADIVVAKVARLFDLKGHEFVLDVAAKTIAAVPGLKYVFVGDGPLRARLEERAARELAPGAVTFTGLVAPERVCEILAASDLLVHASLREGLPRVVVQALLAARSAIAFDVDGTREVIEDGVTGRLVAPRDLAGFSAAIVELGSSAAARASMGAAGRERCRRVYSGAALVEATEALYGQCLEEAARRRLDAGKRP